MRLDGRTAMRSESDECKAEGCRKMPTPSTSFWHFSIIVQLQALAGAQTSFEQLRRSERRALESLQASASRSHNDYCDGNLFGPSFGGAFQSAPFDDELIAHLRLTTDVVNIFEGRRKQKSAWRVTFITLNCDCEVRKKSRSCLLASLIPGNH